MVAGINKNSSTYSNYLVMHSPFLLTTDKEVYEVEM